MSLAAISESIVLARVVAVRSEPVLVKVLTGEFVHATMNFDSGMR